MKIALGISLFLNILLLATINHQGGKIVVLESKWTWLNEKLTKGLQNK